MEKMKEIIEESFYCRKIKENSSLIICSFFVAFFCVIISYPGIFYSDSYGRIDTADKVRAALNLLLSGQIDKIEAIECWVTVIPSVFMAICRMITGNIATYTMAQSFSFFLVSFLLIKRIGTSCKVLQYMLLIINPLFYGMAIYYEAGVGCVIGITVIVLILTSCKCPKGLLDNVIEFGLLALASFVTFGYRANAFTIIPVLAVYILIQNWKLVKKMWVTIALVFGMLMVVFVPKILNVDTMSSGMAGFVWDVLTAIETMEPEEQEEYLDYFDELANEGATQSALHENTDYIVLGYLASELNTYAISADGASEIILEKYLNFIINEPEAYLRTKWNFALRTLGITQQLSDEEYNYNLIDRMWEWGYNDTQERLMFYRKYYAVNDLLGDVVLRPWTVFVITTVLVIWEWFRNSKNRGLYIFLLLIATFYYGAFLINTQSFELRYFYPSLYLMWIMDMAILMGLLSNTVLVIKKRLVKK